MYKYKLFSLNVLTDFNLGFDEVDFDRYDVLFRLCEPLGKETSDSPIMEIVKLEDAVYMVDIHNVAQFIINHEDEVEIHPYSEESFDHEISLHLLGNIFALIMFRRGLFALHGSCIEYKRKAMVITGISGAGKSTLARGFSRRGYKVITDDLAFVNKEYEVLPSYPSQKLWKDAMKAFELEDFSQPIYSKNEKYSVENKVHFLDELRPVSYVVYLDISSDDKVHIRELKGSEKLDVLLANTYRGEFHGMFQLESRHLGFMASLAGRVKVFVVSRPKQGFSVEKQIEMIEEEC